MKRPLIAAVPFLVAAAFTVAPALATMPGGHVAQACQRIDAALAAGKSTSQVEKDLKVSSKQVHRCQSAAASDNNAPATKAR